MAFKLKSGNRPEFKQMGSSPLHYEKDPKEMAKRKAGPKNEKDTGIVYRNGKKYYKAKDGSLHTGQVSDYEQEKKEDEAGVGSGHNRKVMKDDGGKDWKNPHAVKSDFQKKVDAKKAAHAKMTDAEKKAAQDKANAKAKAWRNSPEYKKRVANRKNKK